MRILRPLFALAVILGRSSDAHAQLWEELKTQSPEEIARGQTDFWARTLGLSSQQATELHQINLRYASGLSVAVRALGDDSQKLTAMRAYEEQRTEEVLEELTPAQRERYVAYTEQIQSWVQTRTK